MLGLTGALPDQDNPLAWKRKAREGKLGARDLLASLTDEEIARYMSVAQDQVRIEERFAPLKIMSAIGGAALVIAALVYAIRTSFSGWDIAGLGLGFALVYWPWRVLKCRTLWLKHFEAARAEQARRQTPV